MNLSEPVIIVRGVAWQLCPTVFERLRKMALDKFEGTVELNMVHGQIRSFIIRERIEIPRHEIL